MKNTLLITLVVALGAFGCSQKETTAAPDAGVTAISPTPAPSPIQNPNGVPTTPGGSRSGSGSTTQNWYWTTGGTAILNVDNVGVFEQYTGRPMNAPLDVRLNVDLQPTTYNGQTVYLGVIKVGYHDYDASNTQVYHEGIFDSGSTASDARYNHFLADGWYKGFYEDAGGAVIIVINQKDDNNMMAGEVYFRNFNWDVCNSRPPYDCGYKPPTKCWFISLGPYVCQDYLYNGSINMESRQYPTTYTHLGHFEGLDFKRAFKN